MDTEALCPQLATKHTIITEDTVRALSLSNYARLPGTVVKVTCLARRTHSLIGPDTITCQDTGQWDKPIPICVYSSDEVDTAGVVFDDSHTAGIPMETDDYGIYGVLPYIVSLAILGVACVSLLSLLTVVLHRMGKQVPREHRRSVDHGRSVTSLTGTSQTEYWVEMATSRDSLRHELSQSRDSLMKSGRSTIAPSNRLCYPT